MHLQELNTLRAKNRETLKSKPVKNLRIRFGNLIRNVGMKVAGKYYVCTNCGNVEFSEREVMCWKCGVGEMIYQGRI
jgi:hypothetical protein